MGVHKKNIKLLEQFEKKIKQGANTKPNIKPATDNPRGTSADK